MLAIWEFFWETDDWVPPAPTTLPTGTLLLLGAGRAFIFGSLIKWALEALL